MAMDFFAAQDTARSRSRRLVALFLVSVAGVILSVYLAIMAMVSVGEEAVILWDPDVFVWTAGLTALVVGVASLGKIASLRGGGGKVARSVGGRLVDPLTQDPDKRRLINIVEEMSIAAGIPAPEIYILENEEGINAFAAGFSPGDAAVAVTRGCMTKLNRDELQGVIAHEFSHILNGDMRLNIQLIGLVFGLLVLTIVGRILIRLSAYGDGRRRDSKDGASLVMMIVVFGAILCVVGWIGVLFGRMLQSAVSRQREFLADASAVQLTRNPGGLAGALQKIGAMGSRVENPHSQDVAHLFFANGLRSGWLGLFATHPPLEARIRAIDPGWDGVSSASEPPPLPSRDETPAAPEPIPLRPLGAIAAAMGAYNQLSHAQTIHEQLAKLFGDKWRDPASAADLARALLPSAPDEAESETIQGDREKLSMVPPGDRLALAGMLMPALARLAPDARAALLSRLDRLGDTGVELDAFDFGVWWIMRRNLRRLDQSPKPPGKLNDSAAAFAPDVTTLIASLARVGAKDDEAARQSFTFALAESPSFRPLCHFPDVRPDTFWLDRSLQNLERAAFSLRKEILVAANRAITGDGQVTDAEDALLRVVSLALGCPAPLAPKGA